MNFSPVQNSNFSTSRNTFLEKFFAPQPSSQQSTSSSTSYSSVSLSSTSLRLSSASLAYNDENTAVDKSEAVNSFPLAEKAAGNILGFIATHIGKMQAEDASTEELDKRLSAALKGFEKGFAEAIGILGGLDTLPQSVADSLAETGRLVREGVAEIREGFLPGSSEQVEDGSGAGSDHHYADLQQVAANYAQSYRRRESIDLQIRTNDGDIVTVNFSSKTSSNNSLGFYADSASAGYALSQNSNYASNFQFSVRGELDEGELTALLETLEKISEMSDEFFSGDFQEAYEMALEFEMDSSEFSALSLELAMSVKATVTETYAASSSETNTDSRLAATMQVVDSMREILDHLDIFDQPKELFRDLMANYLAQSNFLAQNNLSEPSSYSSNELDRPQNVDELA